MFSFHKPKIYRSLKGCCICRAKSSSSRFTDSKRYENDFEKCFRIHELRAGEICNACVLLVKRWKKLPAGSNRNWQHVVDARAGPGTKSITKMKMKQKEEKKTKKKHKHHRAIHPSKPPQSPSGLSDDIVMDDEYYSDDHTSNLDHGYLSNSDGSDDDVTGQTIRQMRKKQTKPVQRRRAASPISSFLDLTYWKKKTVCCGVIFTGINGEVLVDTSLLRPCGPCKRTTYSGATCQQNSDAPSDSSTSNDGLDPAKLLSTTTEHMTSLPPPPPQDPSLMALSSSDSDDTNSDSASIAADALDLSLPSHKDSMLLDSATTQCILMEV